VVCGDQVFLATDGLEVEKVGLLHPSCFKCCKCASILNVGNYKSFKGLVYCVNHYKEVMDLSKFSDIKQSTDKKSDSNKPKCAVCSQAVYPMDSLQIERVGTIHQDCLKCSVCSSKLNMSNHKTNNGALYCVSHYQSLQNEINQKGETGLKSTEKKTDSKKPKCVVCQSAVYPMDSLEIEKVGTIHQDCLKCSKCSSKLNMSNHKTHNGALFCVSHYQAIQNEMNQKGASGLKSDKSTGSSTKPKCGICSEPVYVTDCLEYEDKGMFHPQCFKCNKCSTILTASSAKHFKGLFFCSTHYKEKVDGKF
jgi:hypothetical protein